MMMVAAAAEAGKMVQEEARRSMRSGHVEKRQVEGVEIERLRKGEEGCIVPISFGLDIASTILA